MKTLVYLLLSLFCKKKYVLKAIVLGLLYVLFTVSGIGGVATFTHDSEGGQHNPARQLGLGAGAWQRIFT